MKALGRYALFAAMLLTVSLAWADCPGGPNTFCVTSFSIIPGAVVGDQVQTSVGQITAYVPPGVGNQWILQLSPANVVFKGCLPPSATAGSYACFVKGPSVSVLFAGNNSTQSPIAGQVWAYALYNNDPGITTGLTVNPVPPPPGPPQQTDEPCSDCGSGSDPINFTTGDTWISQQDYSIPGLGGGLTLSRTWNSLWPLVQPPEQSGIFGDSWRSNFEERIQVLTGGVVQYWKGDGSRIFYQYDSFSGTYGKTAPADDQTILTFNPTTSLWTVGLKDGTQKIFNSAGYLTSIVDRNGNTITINVDAANQNRIASVTDAAGRALTFSYNNSQFPRLCTAVADSVGTIANYSYTTGGRLQQVSYPDNSQFNFAYDTNGLILNVTDAQAKTIEAHTYDSQRRGLTAQQANGVNKVLVNQYTNGQTNVYDSRGKFFVIKYSTIAQRNYSYMSQGFGCATCGYQYPTQKLLSSSGYVTKQGDPFDQRPTLYTYDTQGNVTSISRPYANNYNLAISGWYTWNYTYNSFGEVLTATDPLGAPGDPNHTTTNAYDAHGNLLSATTPSPDGTTAGSITNFIYDGQGQLTQITDPLQNPTNIGYYPTGLIHTITDAQNNVTTYEYDTRGNRTKVTDAAQNQTQFQYDVMNRLTKITYPDLSTVQFGYDYRGRRTSVTDQNTKTTSYAYDDADRLILVTDAQTPTAGVTQYVYDTENNLTDIYDAVGNHTHMDYDANGVWLSKITFPSGLTEQYIQYDSVWPNLRWKRDRNGNDTHYTYDFQNRLFVKSYADATTVEYDYDAVDRLWKVIDRDLHLQL